LRLGSLGEALAPDAAGADRNLGLSALIALALGVGLRIQKTGQARLLIRLEIVLRGICQQRGRQDDGGRLLELHAS
jgi:hypothetical protein